LNGCYNMPSRIVQPTTASKEEQPYDSTLESAYKTTKFYEDIKRAIYGFTAMWYQNEEWLRQQFQSPGAFFYNKLYEDYHERVGNEETWSRLQSAGDFDTCADILSRFIAEIRDSFDKYDMTVQEGFPLCGVGVKTMKYLQQIMNTPEDYNKALAHITNGIVVIDDYLDEQRERIQAYDVYDFYDNKTYEVERNITSLVRGKGQNKDFEFWCSCPEWESLAEDKKVCSHVIAVVIWTDCVFDIESSREIRTFVKSADAWRRLKFIPKSELKRIV